MMLRRLVRENVIVTVELAARASPVEVDRGQLDQVFMDLVVNASDAMPEGGRLVIRTGADVRGEARLAVEDTGHRVPLTDLGLPGIAGGDLARGLKERWPALRMILMSGYAEDELLRCGVAEGSVRFLQKPFEVAALAREVRAALDKS